MMSMNKVKEIAYAELEALHQYSEHIAIAGSIRRCDPHPNDADIVIVPKDSQAFSRIIQRSITFEKGNIGRGQSHVSYKVQGIEVDVYFASKENFGAMLLHLTGPAGYNIGLRCIAKQRGLLLNQYGLWMRNSTKLVASGEAEIYQAIGKVWKKPQLRGL